MLDHLLALLGGKTTLLGNNLAKHQIDLTRHVGGISTNVECGFLLQKVADQLSLFAQPMLDINLLRSLAGKCSDDLQ